MVKDHWEKGVQKPCWKRQPALFPFPGRFCKVHFICQLNSLPNNNVLDWSKFKELADDKINVTERLKFNLGRVENIVGKGENAGYLQCFQKAYFSGSLKAGIVW